MILKTIQYILDRSLNGQKLIVLGILVILSSCTSIKKKREENFQGKWYINKIVNTKDNRRLPSSSHMCAYIEIWSNDSCVFDNSIKTFIGTSKVFNNTLILFVGGEKMEFKIVEGGENTKVLQINQFVHYLSKKSIEGCES